MKELQAILLSERLPPAAAGKIYGRMQCASATCFGRFGRALLRAFSRRQHEPGRYNINPQIKAACEFWVRNLPTVRPRQVPVNPQNLPLAISYSDGEGGKAGVGVALWLPCGDVLGGYIRVPDALRQHWTQRSSLVEARDIFEIEAVGPLLVLWNWGNMLKDHLWVHFIDNEGSLAALAKGSSSVMSGEVIVGFTQELIAKRGIIAWFDRVDTHSNPVDGLSRGDLHGPWRLVRIRFPSGLATRIADGCRE